MGDCAPHRRPPLERRRVAIVVAVVRAPPPPPGWRLVRSGRRGGSMGRHSAARPRSSRATSVLGAGATALTIASLLAIAQTTVPVAQAGDASGAPDGRGAAAAMDFQL